MDDYYENYDYFKKQVKVVFNRGMNNKGLPNREIVNISARYEKRYDIKITDCSLNTVFYQDFRKSIISAFPDLTVEIHLTYMDSVGDQVSIKSFGAYEQAMKKGNPQFTVTAIKNNQPLGPRPLVPTNNQDVNPSDLETILRQLQVNLQRRRF